MTAIYTKAMTATNSKKRGAGLARFPGHGWFSRLMGWAATSPVPGELERLLVELDNARDLDPSNPTERVHLYRAAMDGKQFVASYYGHETLAEQVGILAAALSKPTAELPNNATAIVAELYTAAYLICTGTHPPPLEE